MASKQATQDPKEDTGRPVESLPDWQRKPLRISFRILAPNRPGRRRDRQQQQMAFFTNFLQFCDDYVWLAGTSWRRRYKQKNVKILEKLKLANMSEDLDFLSCDFDSDQEHYYYTCAFCQAEVYGQAALKDHIESVYLGDLFQFPCRICGFNAEGPKYLRTQGNTI